MWKIYKSMVIGDDHVAANKPCQDRYLIEEADDRFILAVADGHGGRFYCRSDVGAQFACESAIEILRDNTIPWESVPAQIKNLYDRKVEAHLLEKPLTDKELIMVNGQIDRVAYGTTLICCCITPEGVFRTQVGDGDMHLINASGECLEDLPEDANCIGFFTTSLVSPFAAEQFRWSFDYDAPAVVVLHTDGYVFDASRPWDLLELVQTLPDEISQEVLDAGKRGDDQTVLVAIRTDTVETSAFQEGYAKTQSRYRLEERQAHLLERIYTIDNTIKSYINKLSKCGDIRIRNRLIETLYDRQKKFLALCDEYQTLEEQNADTVEQPESTDGNHTIADVTEDCNPNLESMG